MGSHGMLSHCVYVCVFLGSHMEQAVFKSQRNCFPAVSFGQVD